MVQKLFRPSVLTAAFAACLFGVVLGLKWATFDRFGSAMPNWDQWDAEGLELLAPWFEHDHFLQHLFTPHNEHRVVLTKLTNLALVIVDGQWDARTQSVTNALLHSALAVAFWLLAVRLVRSVSSPSVSRFPTFHLSHISAAAFWLLAVALFGLPLAWQNVLGGFHSQQYWLVLTSFAAVVALPFARAGSALWWAAVTAAILALFTMGSGLLAAAVVIAVIGFRLLRRETTLRATWPTLAVCAVLVAAGALTRVEVYYHAHMKVKTAHDFFFSLLHSLQWPVPSGHDWLAAVLWLPWVLAAFRIFFVRDAAPVANASASRLGQAQAGQILVALGGWVLVQLLATAYARGAGADFPSSRYMDTLTFGAMVNALCLAWLFPPSSVVRPPSSVLRSLLLILSTAWLLTFAFGVRALLDRNLNHEMPDAKKYYVQAEAHMRGYLATDDPAHLAFPDIPYPSAGGIVDRLARPSLRALMPAVLRAPLPLKSAAPSVFAENHTSHLSATAIPRHGLSPATAGLASLPTWGSFDAATGPAATGEWTSAPLTAPLGAWLKFETAGHLGAAPATLAVELRDAQTRALLSTVQPSKIPGDTWRAAYVPAPRQPFIVVARDQDSARWLAFSAPVEMGRLSYLAWRATQHSWLLVQLSAGAALALVLLALVLRRSASSVPSPSP